MLNYFRLFFLKRKLETCSKALADWDECRGESWYASTQTKGFIQEYYSRTADMYDRWYREELEKFTALTAAISKLEGTK